ncbi:MAG TPA: hypothetical protein VIN08_05730 [Ohtaekwangia sp.]|uniref:hypothetical protein n=1 Tax=Ohtaekwangia sp. TaxID=2066019 RepID=UPI002F9375E4
MIKYVTCLAMINFVCCQACFSQEKDFKLTATISNPVRDTQVGWFDIDSESFDDYNVTNRSYAVGLIGTYPLSDHDGFRLRLNYTHIEIEEYHNTVFQNISTKTSATGRQDKLTIAPGYVYMLGYKKLNFNVGFEVPFTLHGKYTLDIYDEQRDVTSGDPGTSGRTLRTIPKGYAIGVAAISGFDFRLAKRFSIGAEFSPTLQYARLGGSTTTDNNGQPGVGTEDKLRGITFVEYRFSLCLSVHI